MDMATIRKRWTAEEVRALPYDGRRYELIDGVLIVNGVEIPSGDLADATPDVTPSPTWGHQRIVRDLAFQLNQYVRAQAVGELLFSPADTEPVPDTVAQPDLFVVPLVAGGPPRSWNDVGQLMLAVEILSPTSARSDRVRKRRLYQRAGVPEYWIADPDARLIERWRPEDERGEVHDERLVWQPDSGTPALTIDVEELFAEALGG